MTAILIMTDMFDIPITNNTIEEFTTPGTNKISSIKIVNLGIDTAIALSIEHSGVCHVLSGNPPVCLAPGEHTEISYLLNGKKEGRYQPGTIAFTSNNGGSGQLNFELNVSRFPNREFRKGNKSK